MIAVIVPAHDEALVIGRCLAAISLAAVHPGLRGEPVLVVVALDDCRDATESVCLMQGVTTLAVKVRCVGAARAAAAAHALSLGARWIASTDADTVVPADWLYRQVNCGADAFCGVVEVVDWLDYPQAVRDAFTAKAVVDGHRHVHGANMGISASAYLAAGGFSAVVTGEDVAMVHALERVEARIAWLAQPAVATSARRTARAPQGFSGFLRALEREVLDAGAALLPSTALQR
ncbi:glycosyltransferase [Stenotrophomonas sp. CFBP 13724]|jgi:glycosyltransferase involved in cell wall biosynthesis|uniref:glycosyltransferase n=1 Tax=Stenotrophomonas sp. CFBP 13724 TaxID=2775298 RepID=UPI001782EC3F|nr:glycosyltransferase [Stenotrophomonas sp. CFBP 13724]MBD8643184.1 glycosyltransferase [Stenotrophomonas sp. CFBP 13724]